MVQELNANLAKLLCQEDIDEGDLYGLKLDTCNEYSKLAQYR